MVSEPRRADAFSAAILKEVQTLRSRPSHYTRPSQDLFATLLTICIYYSQGQCHKDNLVIALNVNICINVSRVNKVLKKKGGLSHTIPLYSIKKKHTA